MTSQPSTPDAGKVTSSSFAKLHRVGRTDQLNPEIVEWLNHPHVRLKLQTLMTLLDCSAAEAATIHLLNHIANNTGDIADEAGDDYGPGANPPPPEE